MCACLAIINLLPQQYFFALDNTDYNYRVSWCFFLWLMVHNLNRFLLFFTAEILKQCFQLGSSQLTVVFIVWCILIFLQYSHEPSIHQWMGYMKLKVGHLGPPPVTRDWDDNVGVQRFVIQHRKLMLSIKNQTRMIYDKMIYIKKYLW